MTENAAGLAALVGLISGSVLLFGPGAGGAADTGPAAPGHSQVRPGRRPPLDAGTGRRMWHRHLA